MKVNREELLNDLNMVKAGLSPREFIEQSSCYVFQDGMVMTFNDEVACRKKTGINVTGAVQAASLLSILEKMDDEELKVRENDKGELEFRGNQKGFGVTKDAEIFLPIDRVEMPEKWRTLPKEFTEAIGLVQHCVSQDETRFTLTCIHIHPEYIEACDNLQAIRCKLNTQLKNPICIRGSSLSHLTTLGMDEIALTKSWVHFRNQAGLIFSCRRFDEVYPSLDKFFNSKGEKITIPKGMAEASDRAAVFAVDKSGDPMIEVSLSNGVIRVTGRGLSGWFKEVRKVVYDGEPMRFVISPDLLKHISTKYSDAQIGKGKLKVSGGHWEYITVLGDVEEETESEETEEGGEKE